MKKALKITGIVLGVILLLMIIIPLFFKDQIAGIVKEQANKTLNAQLNFEGVGLNLFENFPNLTVSLDNLTIVNKAPFEGDTLLSLKYFGAEVNLMSVISGDKIKVNSIELNEPKIMVYVLEDSTANYNIMKETAEEEPAAKDTAASSLNLALKKYTIKNASIAYVDQTSGMAAYIKNLNHEGKGDFAQQNFELETETDIESLTFENGGVKLLNNVKVEFDMNIAIDMAKKLFKFEDNKLSLNALTMKFEGEVGMPDTQNINVNMSFAALETDFKNVISLIPAVYANNFNDVKSSGKVSLNGKVSGVYNENSIPSFDIALNVNGGSFQTSQLPVPINNVNVDLNVANQGGSVDNTIVNLKKFHMEVGSEPFDATLLLKTPISDPYVETWAKGKINLGQIKSAVAMEDITKLEGIINADFSAKGNLSSVETKKAESITASGNLSLSNFAYAAKDLPVEVAVPEGALTMSPQKFSLNKFMLKIGQSDMSFTGSIENMLSYVFSDGTIKGNLNISSKYLDLNPFMAEEDGAEQKQTAKDTSKMQAVELPKNVYFVMNASFNKILFDNLTLENVKGVITLENQILKMNKLEMNTLDGKLTATGSYNGSSAEAPSIAFNLDINDFTIAKTYQSFVSVQTLAPMAKYLNGKFSAKLNMTSPLDNTMTPDWNEFYSTGVLNIDKAQVEGFEPLNKVADAIKVDALRNPSLNKINPSFKVEHGKFILSPFTFAVLNNDVTFSGTTGMDKSIDYNMEVAIPAGNLQKAGNEAISKLLKRDVSAIKSSKITVTTVVRGTIDNPMVHSVGSSAAEEATQTVKEEVTKEVEAKIEEKKQEVQQQVEQKTEEIKKQAEDKVKEEAKKKLKGLFKK
jgi:hypothetical protein